MKKYRLKEEVKKYFNIKESFLDAEHSEDRWHYEGVSSEALEEVPQRIELNTCGIGSSISMFNLQKKCGNEWTDQEKDLCEKALNGELLDIDSISDRDFLNWYHSYCELNITDNGIKLVLKAYLKEKNNG